MKRFWNDQLFWPSGLKLEHEQSAAYVSDFLQLHLYPNTPEIALNFSEGVTFTVLPIYNKNHIFLFFTSMFCAFKLPARFSPDAFFF